MCNYGCEIVPIKRISGFQGKSMKVLFCSNFQTCALAHLVKVCMPLPAIWLRLCGDLATSPTRRLYTEQNLLVFPWVTVPWNAFWLCGGDTSAQPVSG